MFESLFSLINPIEVTQLAQAAYTPLVEIPFFTADNSDSSFFNLISSLYNIVLRIGAIAAVVMIAYGGVTYATAGGPQAKTDAREKIQNALIGLVALLAIFIFFNEINPDILDIRVNTTQQSDSSSVTLPNSPTIPQDAQRRQSILPFQNDLVQAEQQRVVSEREACAAAGANFEFREGVNGGCKQVSFPEGAGPILSCPEGQEIVRRRGGNTACEPIR